MSVYEIRVKGHLDPRWSEWFGGLRITNEPNGEALLSGYSWTRPPCTVC